MKRLNLAFEDDREWLEGLRAPLLADPAVTAQVRDVLLAVQTEGDIGRSASVSSREVAAAAARCEPAQRRALELEVERMRTCQSAQLPRSTVTFGGRREQRVVPLERVGVVIPGGSIADLLMNAVPARVAGVAELILCVPPDQNGGLDPTLAAACELVGVDRVFLIGGARAVGSLAFGTRSVPRVDLVCGRGAPLVVEAGRQVSGISGVHIGGMCDLLVLDAGGDARVIAGDFLTQPGAVLCVTTDRLVWNGLPRAVAELLAASPDPAAAERIEGRGAVVFADTLDAAVEFANGFAPRRLRVPSDAVANRIRTAGAVYVGDGGDDLAASWLSGVAVEHFVRRVNVVRGGQAGGGRRKDDGAGYVLPEVRRQQPYTLKGPPAAPVKLNQNEAADDLSPELKERLLARFRGLDWRRYPEFDPTTLKGALANADGWRSDGVLVGNGSNELLTLLIRSIVGPGDTVALASPGFGLYPLHLELVSARVNRVALSPNQDFAYDEAALLAAARSAKVVFLGSPNNPTGSMLELGTVKRLLAETDALVVIDEAYRDFASQDFAPLLGRQTPLVLLRTYSAAMAMAGLRFGYLLGPPALCSELHKVLLPYNVNSLTQAAVLDLISQRQARVARVAHVQAERSRLAAALRSMGRHVVEGGANFLLFQSTEPGVEFKRLLELGVLVRDLSSSVPGFLRVSIGTRAESDRFVESLEEISLQDALSDMNA